MLDRTEPDETAPPGGALRDALRRARAEAAAQTDAVVDLRTAEIARLELLREELVPVFAQTPREIDIFDFGLAPGERPRLFIDMVAFVEMDRDRRTYRFMRDGRHGRGVIAESEQLKKMADEVTSYVARRLVERERLLADDDRIAGLSTISAATLQTAAPQPAPQAIEVQAAPVADAPARRDGGWRSLVKLLLSMAVGVVLGSIAVAVFMYAVAVGIIPL